MRYVFLENDTKLLFCTAYDGDWDPYIDDFATIIPDDLDVVFSNCEGWPGVRNPAVKDFIVKHQITAHGWYVGNPNVTVKDTRRLEKIGAAVEESSTRLRDARRSLGVRSGRIRTPERMLACCPPRNPFARLFRRARRRSKRATYRQPSCAPVPNHTAENTSFSV
jgi:hypothetical protein